MQLSDLSPTPSSLIALERFVNEGTRTYSPHAAFSGVHERYQSHHATPSFFVPTFLVPKSEVHVIRADPDPKLERAFVQTDGVFVPIHPDIRDDPAIPFLPAVTRYPAGRSFGVQPTASTRTVLVGDPPGPFFLKLHLPRRISRFVRRLRWVSVQFSVMISADLREFRCEGFGYLPETIGIAIGDRATGWGAVVREWQPRPALDSDRILIPAFALFGHDRRRPTDPQLLKQLIDRHQADPLTFVTDIIVGPLIRQWCQAYRERGIIFGSHAQNVLMELDLDYRPTRLIHRDLDVQVDPAVRQRRGLSTGFPKSRIGIEIQEPIERALSLKYDWFMGHHFFDYLARVLQDQWAIDPHRLSAAARDIFHDAFPEADRFFDRYTYYYRPEPSPDNDSRLLRTDVVPVWR